MTPRIEFDRVTKRYRLGTERGNVWGLRGAGQASSGHLVTVLDDVSFQLAAGDRLAIVGPNGAGKSTLLRLLAHITTPSSGRVRTSGRIAALLELGAAFHPNLTGRANVFFMGSLIGVPPAQLEARYDEIVAFAGLERFMDTPVKRYSSGMATRLGFAIATSLDADILIVDEALGVGDIDFRQRSVERIAQRADEGATVIVVSHNLEMVRSLCTRALHLEAGRVVEMGPSSDVIDRYQAALPGPVGAADFVPVLPGELHLDRQRIESGSGFTATARFDLELAEPTDVRLVMVVRAEDGAVVGEYPSGPELDQVVQGGSVAVTAAVAWFPLIAGRYDLAVSVEGAAGTLASAPGSIEVFGDSGSRSAQALIAEIREHAVRSQVAWSLAST